MAVDGNPCLRIAQMTESDGPGGSETMLLQLSLELRRRGHLVTLVGPARGTGWLAEQAGRHALDLVSFALRRPIDPGGYRRLRDQLRRLQVDVVHSHEFTMAVYGAAAARALRLRHVVTLHGGLYMLERWRRRIAVRWAVGVSAAAVAVSQATRRIFSERLGISAERLTVVPNGICETHGDRARARAGLGLHPGELLILAVGNVMGVKGHLTLVEALVPLADGKPTWRLAIAGHERDAAGPIRALLERSSLGDRVRLLGYRDDVHDLLAAADVFAMPSRSEGLPVALLEAMFASRCVVATSVGGIPEVIRDGQEGLLVPPNDPDALARALRRGLEDADLRDRLGRAARARAVEHYSVAAMADRYERLYYPAA